MTAAVANLKHTVIGYLLVVQDFTLLSWRTVGNLFRPPFYGRETILQMDRIGVGSLFIVVLTGMFTGMVLALQGAVQLEPYGATIYVSRLISTSVVRELGPVLAALMIACPSLFDWLIQKPLASCMPAPAWSPKISASMVLEVSSI